MRYEFIIKRKNKNYRFVIHNLLIDERERAINEARTIVELFPHRKADSYFKNLKELLGFRK